MDFYHSPYYDNFIVYSITPAQFLPRSTCLPVSLHTQKAFMKNFLSEIYRFTPTGSIRTRSWIHNRAAAGMQSAWIDRSFALVRPVHTRMSLFSSLLALVAIGCCLNVQAAPLNMTFEQAVKEGTNLKGCPKRNIGLIESAYLTDSEGNPEGVRPGKLVYLILAAEGATDMPVMGPLATPPTERQLQALKGRRICVLSE